MNDELKSRGLLLSFIIHHSSFCIPFCSLPQGLIKHYARSDGDVKRFDVAPHGNADERVATLAHQAMQACAFAAKEKSGRLPPIPISVKQGRVRTRSDCPDVTF